MEASWLGRVPYDEALKVQHRLVDERLAGAVDDQLLLLEHDPVYTAGQHADVAHNVLGTTAIPVVATDRGGDVTYHGPGQLVAYPIVRLDDPKGVRAYVGALQEACVRTAARFGITAHGDRKRTGVWAGDEKLVAIGIRVQRGVTSHGLAFNVTTDLADYDGIVPCGIRDAGVCSLASLGASTTVREVADVLAVDLAAALRCPLTWSERSTHVHTPG